MGIEVSKLFDCGLDNEQRRSAPRSRSTSGSTRSTSMGVRDMELVNKFDNALAGVAGDSGTTGVVVNAGNRIETGKFWQMQPRATATTTSRTARSTRSRRSSATRWPATSCASSARPAIAPVYPPAPHCNVRGLSSLGAHLVQRMIAKDMIIDPDHLSVRARQQLLDIVEAADYSGDHLQPLLEHAGRRSRASTSSAGFVDAVRGGGQGLRRRSGASSGSCATSASTRASAGART